MQLDISIQETIGQEEETTNTGVWLNFRWPQQIHKGRNVAKKSHVSIGHEKEKTKGSLGFFSKTTPFLVRWWGCSHKIVMLHTSLSAIRRPSTGVSLKYTAEKVILISLEFFPEQSVIDICNIWGRPTIERTLKTVFSGSSSKKSWGRYRESKTMARNNSNDLKECQVRKPHVRLDRPNRKIGALCEPQQSSYR